MISKMFVSKTFLFLLIFLGIFFYFLTNIWFMILYVMIVSGSLYLFRKNHLLIDLESNEKDKVLLAPVNGKIVSIEYNVYVEELDTYCTQVQMRMDFFDGYGLYLPSSAEVDYLMRHRGMSFFRFKKSFKLNKKNGKRKSWAQTNLRFKNNDGNYYLISFIRCFLGSYPRLWLKSGDKGKSSACMGVMPFGGTLCLYLPTFFDICINENTKILAGETMIAAIKGKK